MDDGERINAEAFQQWAESIMAHGVVDSTEAKTFAAHALAVLEELQEARAERGTE